MLRVLGFALLFIGMAGVALPNNPPPAAPEIGGSSLANGLTLVSGALVVARARRAKKG